MSPQSRSNRHWPVLGGTLILVLVSILMLWVLGALDSGNKKTLTIYHQSSWNEYIPDVEMAVKNTEKTEKPELSHIYGAVMSHHIPTTIPELTKYYLKLKQNQTVENIIIIGPDHTNAGDTPISTSQASFVTNLAELRPIPGMAERLVASGLVQVDEKPFDPEHSIGSQVLVISKIFPEARITPIIFRSDAGKEESLALGVLLGQLLDEKTVLVASVDFSHYLSAGRAMPIDQISGSIIKNLDIDAVSAVKVDSVGAVLTFMQAMRTKKSFETDSFQVQNTSDYMDNTDYTTGYVFGFWGL